jgi:MATE family multidrug resistance protein
MNKFLQLAVPMILANLTVPLTGVVDTIVMGHLGSPVYLGAVGIGVMLFDFLYWGFGFLRMGTTGLAAQAYGTGDYEKQQAILYRHLSIALLIGLVLILLQNPINLVVFDLIKASPDLTQYASRYFKFRIWGAPAVLTNYVFIGWFIGTHKPKIALLITAVINIIAAALDYYFVYHLEMKTTGVALAGVIAQYAGFGISIFICRRLLEKTTIKFFITSLLDREKMIDLFHLNKDIFLRTLCLILVYAIFTRQGTQLGQIILTANVVLMNFQNIMAYALDGFANAAEALVGNAMGLKRKDELCKVIRITRQWSLAIAVLFSIIYTLFGHQIITLLTSISEVQLVATRYLIYIILLPLVSVWSFWLDGIFVGATRSREMRNTMVISLFTFIVVYIVLSTTGNDGLWIALLCFMAMRAISMGYLLYRRPILLAD